MIRLLIFYIIFYYLFIVFLRRLLTLGESPSANGRHVHRRSQLDVVAGIYDVEQIPRKISADYSFGFVFHLGNSAFEIAVAVPHFYKDFWRYWASIYYIHIEEKG